MKVSCIEERSPILDKALFKPCVPFEENTLHEATRRLHAQKYNLKLSTLICLTQYQPNCSQGNQGKKLTLSTKRTVPVKNNYPIKGWLFDRGLAQQIFNTEVQSI